MIDNINIKTKTNLLKLLKYNISLNEELSKLTHEQWDEIIKIAKRHHVKEYLYYNLKKNKLLNLLDDCQINRLKTSFKKRTISNLSKVAELKKVIKNFEKENIPIIALKGLHLIQEVYPHIALRYLRDLDILIPKNKSEQAVNILNKLEYTCKKKLTKSDFNFEYYHHIQPMHKKNSILELHGELSDNKKVDIDKYWKDANFKNYCGFLSIEDLIIHLCIHISYSDLFKNDLRHYLDIYIIIEEFKNKINWELLKKKIELNKCEKGTYIVFNIVKDLFDIKIPLLENNTNKINQTILNNSLEFLWLYDKKSKDYAFYRFYDNTIEKDKNFIVNVISRIFINKAKLSHYYSIEQNNKFIYFYYFRRFYDLVKTHSLKVVKMNTNNDKMSFLNKTKQVHDFLIKGN